MPQFSFPASQRLKNKREFDLVQRCAKKLHARNFLLLVAPARHEKSRLGITVTIKVDPTAVGRNRIKRCVREIFRLHQAKLLGAFDIVVIARQNAPQCSFAEIKKQLLGALQHHGYSA